MPDLKSATLRELIFEISQRIAAVPDCTKPDVPPAAMRVLLAAATKAQLDVEIDLAVSGNTLQVVHSSPSIAS